MVVSGIPLGDPFDTPPNSRVTVSDFGPGRSNRVEVHHGGRTIVIAAENDASFRVPQLISPSADSVDVVIHGRPGRFGTTAEADVEVPIDVLVRLLQDAGVPQGTPLRCISCHAGEVPSAGPSAAEQLAVEWHGSVLAPDGFVLVMKNAIRIDVGDWSPDPVAGDQQFEVHPPNTPGYPNGGQGRGLFHLFTP